MLRFWTMLAHYHGQIWSAAEPARSLAVSEPTARRYLDILSGVFMIRQLQPWYANLKKRQVKAPKIYFRDTGLLHHLLGIRSEKELVGHPKCGASWEGYVIEETLKAVEPDEAYFWATHSGAEIDLVLRKNGRLFGIECKRVDAPRLTPSMRIALEDLQLQRIVVIYPGTRRYALAQRVTAVPLEEWVDNATTTGW
jgi:predicted AAA+ superfamily ATPase